MSQVRMRCSELVGSEPLDEGLGFRNLSLGLLVLRDRSKLPGIFDHASPVYNFLDSISRYGSARAVGRIRLPLRSGPELSSY